jgi:hypothetical protein
MSAQILDRTASGCTLAITIPYHHSMLDFEEHLQQRLHEAGVLATQEGRRQFDPDGSPITLGSLKLTTTGQLPTEYQTPSGVATLARHGSQSSQGGGTDCPRDRDARIIVRSTPKFAKLVASQYAEWGSARVQHARRDNHGRSVSRCWVQDIAAAVAAVALVTAEDWSYPWPPLETPPPTGVLSLDGTCTLMGEDGWRATLVGTLSVDDTEGERPHRIALAATPAYGQATWLGRWEAEVTPGKPRSPAAQDVGSADGAQGNWEFLERPTAAQVVDCWQAAEYLGQAVAVIYRGQPATRQSWREASCQTLKHDPAGAATVLNPLKSLAQGRPWAKDDEDVQRALTEFAKQSQAGRMEYAPRVARKEPIGSGVTEAACQVSVKQRLCGSGMKWKESGAAGVWSRRCLNYTPGRWDQFWQKIDRWGFPVAA